MYATHWIFGDKRTNNSGFAPGSPNRPSVFFHVNLLQNLYIEARDGLSMKKIWLGLPKARLVVAYDIACRMSSAIAVQTISIYPLF